MVWDTDVTTVSFIFSGGGGVGNVSTNALYDGTSKIVRLNVTTGFGNGRSVQISGLRFRNFTSGTEIGRASCRERV